jgi:hypothetical protein
MLKTKSRHDEVKDYKEHRNQEMRVTKKMASSSTKKASNSAIIAQFSRNKSIKVTAQKNDLTKNTSIVRIVAIASKNNVGDFLIPGAAQRRR